MTLDQYLLVFPMKHEHNVSAVLRHISEQLQGYSFSEVALLSD